MLLIPFYLATVSAELGISKARLAKIPIDLMMPIVANIGSYEDLVALNLTSKAFFPIIRPIFDFASACQIRYYRTWPSARLDIHTDRIINMNTCAVHLMHYSSLYSVITLDGTPSSIISFLDEITTPIQSPSVHLRFLQGSLDTYYLTEVIQSIKYGSFTLDLYHQAIDQDIVNLLTMAIDRRTMPESPFNAILFGKLNQTIPSGVYADFFRALSHSDLNQISFFGFLNNNFIIELAAVLPKSKLRRIEFTVAPRMANEALQSLGAALMLTHTMKKISLRFVDSSSVILRSMIPGLALSNIQELRIIDGKDMDLPISLITALPSSLRVLDLSGNGMFPNLNATTIVHIIGAVSRSNVQYLDLRENYANLALSDLHQISNYIFGSKLKVLNLADNGIDAEGNTIFRTANPGMKIITRSILQ